VVDGIVTELIETLDPGTFASESIAFDLAGRITVDSPDLSMALDVTQRLALANFSPEGREVIRRWAAHRSSTMSKPLISPDRARSRARAAARCDRDP